MKLPVLSAFAVFLGIFAATPFYAQTFTSKPAPSNTEQLDALAKKIDEQNVKIDTLSQQILKLEQAITNMRPGVMVGEATPTPTPVTAMPTTTTSSAPPANGANTHTVARGETLTSIAKMYNVSVTELQKSNHIENDRKLQAGQTITIPGSPAPAASATPTP